MDVQKHNLVGIELLRIVAMMMVVGLHYLNFGGILWSEAVTNRRIAWGIEAFLFVAVNCYVLISGYFLVKAKNFHWSKVGALWVHTAFYALLFTLAAIVYTGKWNLAGIVHSLLPIRYTMYWFVTAYMGMYILSPYLSRLACHLEKNEYKKFLMILTGLFVLYSFLRQDADPFKIGGGYTMAWFCVLFFWGGYIRLFGEDFLHRFSQREVFLIYVLASLFTFLAKKPMHYFFDLIGVHISGHSFSGFYMYNSPSVLLASLALFVFFLRLEISSERIKRCIQRIAPLSFGVYLIHEHPFIRSQLWGHWIHLKPLYESPYFMFHFIGTVLLVFLVCILLDKVRDWMFSLVKRFPGGSGPEGR